MVEQLCSLEILESLIEGKVEGYDVLVASVYDEENFDDEAKMKKYVCVKKEKEFVLVNNDDDDVEDADKQTPTRKRVRKRKIQKKEDDSTLAWGSPTFQSIAG